VTDHAFTAEERRAIYRVINELTRWGGGEHRYDGVPARAAGPRDAIEVVPIRDFAAAPPPAEGHARFAARA